VKNKDIYTITNSLNERMFNVTDDLFVLDVANPKVKISPIFK